MLQDFDGRDEVVTLDHQQVDVVEFPATTETVRQVVARIHGFPGGGLGSKVVFLFFHGAGWRPKWTTSVKNQPACPRSGETWLHTAYGLDSADAASSMIRAITCPGTAHASFNRSGEFFGVTFQ